MLPRRGAFLSGLAPGLRHTASSQSALRSSCLRPSMLAGSSRSFGTVFRSNGRSSLLSRSLTLESSRRIGIPTLTAALLTPLRHNQARFKSTNPSSSPLPPDLSTPLNLDGPSLLDIPEHIGYLHSLGIDFGWGPTSTMQWILEHIHVYSGMPWWGSIAAVCIVMRVMIFWPSVRSAENSFKLTELRKKPGYMTLQNQLKEASFKRTVGGRNDEYMQLQAQMMALHRASGFKWSLAAVPLINIPISIGMFRLLRAMVALPVPGLENGGVLWFQDLSVADPYYILPMVSAGITFYIMRASLPYMAPKQQGIFRIIGSVIAPMSFFVTMNFGAGVQWFFLVSALLQLVQSTIFFQPWFRRFASLPPMQLGGDPDAPDPFGWQKPRTLDTTARVLGPNPIERAKSAMSSAKGKASTHMEKQKVKKSYQDAQEYERKRSLEEQRKKELREEERRFKTQRRR